MPDEYYRLAEEEFATAVDEYNKDHWLDIAAYKAPTDHVWIEQQEADLFVGRRVKLVNGQEADIVEVDEGLMAVLCPAGENSIDFVYQPDGIRLSHALTLGGIVVWLAYTAYFVWRKRRTKRA